MNVELSVEEALRIIDKEGVLVLKPSKALSSKSGYLEINQNGFRLKERVLGIGSEKDYLWTDIEEFGVNTIRNTGKLSFVVKYNVSVMVGWNFTADKKGKLAAGMGKFMNLTGHDCKYMDGGFRDNYGLDPHSLSKLMNLCLGTYRDI